MKPILKNHVVLSQIKSIHEFFALLEYGMKEENRNSSCAYHQRMGKVLPYAFFNHWTVAQINIAIKAGNLWAVRKKSNIENIKKQLKTETYEQL